MIYREQGESTTVDQSKVLKKATVSTVPFFFLGHPVYPFQAERVGGISFSLGAVINISS